VHVAEEVCAFFESRSSQFCADELALFLRKSLLSDLDEASRVLKPRPSSRLVKRLRKPPGFRRSK
jgi:hypothetical protein